jgi:hypothetical protein
VGSLAPGAERESGDDVIGIEFNDGGLSVSLANAPAVTTLLLQKFVTGVETHLLGALARNMGNGGLIGVRTGDLRRALKMQPPVVTTDGIEGSVYVDPAQVAYGAIQEEGGTVVPKTAQFLAIPLEAMQTGNGVARGTARQVISEPGAFGFSGTFVAKGVIFGKEGGDIIPLFALKSEVTLPGRHYLSETLTQEAAWIEDYADQTLGELVSVTFGDAGAA